MGRLQKSKGKVGKAVTKQARLYELYNNYREKFNGQEIVTGEGNPDTDLLLIGEAPGKTEVEQSKPFVGAAGKNLSEFLEVIGVERESIYITNAIKYRLKKINESTGRASNRPALKEEIDENREYLLKEVEIIKPKYIITLGNVPLKAVTSKDLKIGEIHGEVRKINLQGEECNLFALYHPASIIYNKKLKEVYVEDLVKLKEILGDQ